MQIYLTSEQMREADRRAITLGTDSETLMNRAGCAVADEVQAAAKRLNVRKISVVCGTGNNGGDGYVVARELLTRGFYVQVQGLTGQLSADCQREKAKYEELLPRTAHLTFSGKPDIIIDCIFGTGLNRDLQGGYAEAVNAINNSGAYVIAADIPSGINGDNGLVMGVAVRADITVAIACCKLGCVLGDGIDYCGKIIVKDIGIVAENGAVECAARSLHTCDLQALSLPRRRNSHKGDYGTACLVAGSEEYLGAATLTVSTALKSGCGYVRAVVPAALKYSLAVAYPQAIYEDEPYLSAGAIAVGMGLGCSEQTYKLVCALVKGYEGKLIIDADGLNALAKYGKEVLKEARGQILLTPHIGEMSRLCGLSKKEVLDDPVCVAQKFAAEYNVVVHLKNAVSATCDGRTATLTLRGTSALAKAGSGDMLAGLICGNAARGLSLYDAAVYSQNVLGCAAELYSKEYYDGTATHADLINNLAIAIKRLTR